MTGEAAVRIDARDWLDGDAAGAMDFLNGVAERYPAAISLAAGRPPDDLIPAASTPDLLRRGIAYEAGRRDEGEARAWRRFGQYSDTDGIVGPALQRLMAHTEQVDGGDLAIQVTNGIQEALLIECLWAAGRGGAAIAFDPAYVGIAGAAAVAGLPLYMTPRGDDPVAAMAAAIRSSRRDVRGPLLCYVVADHDNPTSLSLSRAERQALVDLAAREGVLILEDSAYRFFNYDGGRLPTLLALDTAGHVIHLVSFSKTFMPGLRFGFSARRRDGAAGGHRARLTEIKSYASVLTSPLLQAAVVGYLDLIGDDIEAENAARRALCRDNRDVLDRALADGLTGVEGVRWRKPAGGFFVTVRLPFAMSGEDALAAARDFGVITVPMRMFSPTGRMANVVRLSFSAASPDALAAGAARFSDYVRARTR